MDGGGFGKVYLVKRKPSGGPGYNQLVFAVKVVQRFWRTVELKVFSQTVGNPYLLQLVSFFQTWVCSSYLRVQLLILKFIMTVNIQRCSCMCISVRSDIGHLLLLLDWSQTKNRGIFHQSQLCLYFYLIYFITLVIIRYMKPQSALRKGNYHSKFL